jgi:hypothetical protein
MKLGRTLAWVGLAGCADVSSGDLATSGMWAEIRAEADGSGSSLATAVLKAGGELSNTFVELEGDDELVATLEDDTRDMLQEDLFDAHRYVAQFDSAPVGVPYAVALVRTLDAGAPSTTVELPPAFELDPPSTEPWSRLDDLVLSWGPASEQDMHVDISGSCIVPYHQQLTGDPATFTLPGGTLTPLDEDEPTSCDLEIRVSRILPGTLDPSYGEGGRALGVQHRATHVSSQP